MPAATIDRPAVTSFPNVQLCAVGNWLASKGDGQITAEDIASMAAAYKNRYTDAVPIKIGHDENDDWKTFDGAPSLGWVENVHASDDGQMLLGDLVGIPSKLADIVPVAFRRRSIEAEAGARVSGQGYRMVLTGLALLGVAAPAVKGLDDLVELYGSTAPTPSRFLIEDSDDTPTIQPTFKAFADGERTPTSGGRMAHKLSKEQLAAFGIPEDADDAAVTAKLKELGLSVLPEQTATEKTGEATTAEVKPTETTEVKPAETVTATTEVEPQKIAASAKKDADGNIVLTPALFAAWQESMQTAATQAQQGAAAFAAVEKSRKDKIFLSMVGAGKIPPSAKARELWRKALDENEESTVALLSAQDALYPVGPELGHQANYSAAPDAGDFDQRAERAANSFIPGNRKA